VTTVSFSRRQNEILDALSALIVDEGFAELTVGDLADRLRCSRRTLYTLAASRDALLVGVIERLFDTWSATCATMADAAGEGSEAVVAFLVAAVAHCGATPRFLADVAAHPDAAMLYDTYRKGHLADLCRLIEASGRSGSVADSAIVAEVLDAAAERLHVLSTERRYGMTVSSASMMIAALVRTWLAPESAR